MTYPMQLLAVLGNIQTGSTPSTSEDKFWGGDYPFVTPAELDQSPPITTTPRTLSDEGAAESRILQQGAVMVCCIGSLGKIAIAGRSVVTNQQINSIEFDTTKVLPRYGYYACQRLKPKLLSMAPATTIPIVSKSKFGQLEIPVPPIPEQRRIAAILDQADALRAKRREALAQLDSLTQSIFIEMFGDPVDNPKKFPISRLGDACDVRDGTHDSPDYVAEGYPLLTSKNLRNGRIDFTDVNFISEIAYREINRRSKVDRGDILMPMIGTIGNPVLVSEEPQFAIKNMALIKFHSASPCREFVLQFLSGESFDRLVTGRNKGGTQKFLALGEIRALPLPVPPLILQHEFSRRIAAVKDLRSFNQTAHTEVDSLFASLQRRAFQGEL